MITKNITKWSTRIKSKGRYRHLELMRRYEYKPNEELIKLQKKKLFHIVNYAIENVPYYENEVKKRGITFSESSIFEDIKKIPILKKETIRERFEDLKSKNYKGSYYRNHTGGSSGKPLEFLQDLTYNEQNKAAKLFFSQWTRWREGDFTLKIWGSQQEVMSGGKGVKGLLREKALNIKVVDSFQMSEEKMRYCVEIINKKKPKLIEGYVQSIYEFAKFIKKNNLRIRPPKGIITAAGTLHENMRMLIEEVFGCKVFNQYGSRDAGMMAFSCEEQKGLHLNVFNNYIEVLDQNLNPCKPGETGKVYVTLLNNYVMPFIRYDIGDLATLDEENDGKCLCGRGLPIIKRVEGRETTIFKTKDGKIIPGEFFIHFVGVVFNKGFISRFQVIQEDYDHIVVKVVVKDKKSFNQYRDRITESIKKVMGDNCLVDFDFVENIESLNNGKYLYTISKVC
jgi:phenylacetate-CoA ligase